MFLYPQETFLSNYADDNTLYSIGNTIESIKKALSNNFRIIQNWFMQTYGSKCREMSLLVFGTRSENDDFILDGIKLSNSCKEKILGLIIDNELKFGPHIRSMCKKSNAKGRSAKQNILIIRP